VSTETILCQPGTGKSFFRFYELASSGQLGVFSVVFTWKVHRPGVSRCRCLPCLLAHIRSVAVRTLALSGREVNTRMRVAPAPWPGPCTKPTATPSPASSSTANDTELAWGKAPRWSDTSRPASRICVPRFGRSHLRCQKPDLVALAGTHSRTGRPLGIDDHAPANLLSCIRLLEGATARHVAGTGAGRSDRSPRRLRELPTSVGGVGSRGLGLAGMRPATCATRNLNPNPRYKWQWPN